MTNQTNSSILTITLNPALDVFIHVEQLEPGTLHRTSQFRKNPGGKGINVAKALNAFGTPVLAAGFLGGANGDWIEHQLSEQKIANRFVKIPAETRSNVKVVERQGELTELNSPSPGLTPADWVRFDDLLEQAAQKSSWVAFCGNLPEHCPADWYRKAIIRCQQFGVKTAVDTSGEALKKAVQAKPDFIKPNLEEFQQLTGKNVTTIEEVVQAARELTAADLSTVAVTLGAGGMVVAQKKEAWIVTVPEVNVVSPVGAGDSVVAGFLHGFYHQYSIEDTVRFAAACGVCAVMKEGTAQPEPAEVTQLLSRMNIQKLEG